MCALTPLRGLYVTCRTAQATIKSGEELTRLLQLPSAASHTHLQQHAHFLRLLSPSLLRDPYNHSGGSGNGGGNGGHHGALLGELDQLIDAWLRTMFSRYRGANGDGGGGSGSAAAAAAAEDDPVAFMKRAQNTLTWLAQVGTATDDDDNDEDDNDRDGDNNGHEEKAGRGSGGIGGGVYRTLLLVR